MPGKFTSIPGVSDQRRLPRLGKIRLGMKVPTANGKGFRPTETEYFVVPEEVAKVYGDKPTKLDVMLPVIDQSVVFPVAYKAYKRAGLFCIGNGEFAERREGGEWVERGCPCPMLEKKECRRSATLSVVLPKVNIGGVYQIVTGSIHSIMDVLSGMDYARALLQGKLAWQPLVLQRTEKEVPYTDDQGNQKKRKHFTMLLNFEGDVDFANKLIATNRGILTDAQYLLPAPNEALHDDPPDLVEEDDLVEAVGTVVTGSDGDSPEPMDAERVPTGERGADDATPPGTPSGSSAGSESAAHQEAKKDFAKQLMGACKAVAGPDGAIDLFTFFVKEHLGAASSADIPPAKIMPIIDKLVAIGEIQDDKEMKNTLEEYKWELMEQNREPETTYSSDSK